MAKIFKSEKWKKRTLTALSAALATSLTFGALAACAPGSSEKTEESPAAPKDTQLLKNGNFEFYSDNNLDDVTKKFNLINSPNSWTFTSGSPSSDTASGIINTADWDYFTKTGGYNFQTFKKESDDDDEAEEVTTFRSIEEAVAHWEDDNVSAYDRIKFYDIFEDEIDDLASNSEAAQLFAKYRYKVDFEDIKDLAEDFPQGVKLHDGVEKDESSVLMIHNSRTSDDVRGTAQYYTSGTTITLSAGTSAKVSVWARTDKLYHYTDTELKARGGAYIGVTNTVGGTTLDQMQIYNINTEGEWREYTVYVRASTFATSTFTIVLGLGQGSSEDRYFSVDGYALFDDVKCEVISNSDYEDAVLDETVNNTPKSGVRLCTVDSLKDEKRFDTDSVSDRTFALDLYAGFPDKDILDEENLEIGLTEEQSGSKTYTSADIDPSLGEDETLNFTTLTNLDKLSKSTQTYVKNVYEKDFKDKFPFENEDIVMLLSGNGAAYTAKITSESFTLDPNTRLLISFFAKTSEILSGLTGASAFIVDGETRTEIPAFDSTNITTVDIDSKSEDPEKKDIYKGWVQCFFFVQNDTESKQTFVLELAYGPTTITSTSKFSYGDGYAAFANFETKLLSKTEYSYASTGDRAKKVSLTGGVEDTKNFDSVSVTDEKTIEQGPALPANFRGVLGGSDFVQNNEDSVPNVKPEGVIAGLVSHKYAENYFNSEEESWTDVFESTAEDAEAWWKDVFGNARQPLLIINNDADVSYGYFAETASVSSSSYQRISMRVKASEGAKVFIYLTETSYENSGKSLSPDLPAYSYWYDDDGNIVNMDPKDEKYEDEGKILFELQPNGLYKSADGGDTYYANLHNFPEDSEGNKVTKDGEIVFYFHDGKFYAYREGEKEENYQYKTVVENLPTDKDKIRYDYSDKNELPLMQMEIEGTGKWETVSFYIHTGNKSVDYRLEVWNGSRDGKTTNKAKSYVLFDNYISESASNYSSLLNEAVGKIKDLLNENKTLGGEGYIGADDNLPKNDLDCYRALYYTFSFFDSTSYVRYDETLDEEKLGNPWGSYLQSNYKEQLFSLYFADKSDEGTTYSYYLDYSSIDVTVTPDDLSKDDGTTDNTSSATLAGDTNIWMLISSGILAVVLLVVIVLVIIRRALDKRSRNKRIKKPAKA